jgi:virulence-associated protein VagC
MGSEKNEGRTMRATAKKNGLTIPKRLLKGVAEFEVKDLGKRLVLVPAGEAEDPVFSLGEDPRGTGLRNAPRKHDEYLYGRRS